MTTGACSTQPARSRWAAQHGQVMTPRNGRRSMAPWGSWGSYGSLGCAPKWNGRCAR